ncbi:MAG: glycoside hydrolase family 97 N-terminal domain-containing protein, partial [Saprospiraceae bacterium]|nr:glycoside hydrolase family 97 N-terminal domain-containing protein [Saprospiraceae bacterium]
MKATSATVIFLILTISLLHSQNFRVSSPDGTIEINVKLTDRIYYNLVVDGREVMWYSPLSMTTSQGTLGDRPQVIGDKITSADDSIKTVWGSRRMVSNHYRQLELDFQGGYRLLFRAFDDGIAYRFLTELGGELLVYDEEIEYRFWENHKMINHVVDSYTTSYEKTYSRQYISDVGVDNLISLPSIIDVGEFKLAVVESDLYNYPGFYLTRKGSHNRYYLNGSFPKYPKKWEPGGHGLFNLIVEDREPFIAKTVGKRAFPWRALVVARADKDLVDSDLVYKLARPAEIETDWIQPGKVAWDWWN